MFPATKATVKSGYNVAKFALACSNEEGVIPERDGCYLGYIIYQPTRISKRSTMMSGITDCYTGMATRIQSCVPVTACEISAH